MPEFRRAISRSIVQPRFTKKDIKAAEETRRRAGSYMAFEELRNQKKDIEQRIGAPLEWDILSDRRTSRISIARPFDISDPQSDRNAAVRWGVETMLAFYDAFMPRLGNL